MPGYQRRISTAQEEFDVGLTDLVMLDQGSGARIVAWGPGEGVLVGLALGQGVQAVVSDTQQLGGAQVGTANRVLSVVEYQGRGSSNAASTGYVMQTQGDFGSATTLAGVGGPDGGLLGLVQAGNGTLYGLRDSGVVAQFDANASGGYTDTTRTIDVYGPTAMATAQVGSTDFVLVGVDSGRGQDRIIRNCVAAVS